MPTELTVSPAGDATLLSLLRQDGTLLESPCNGKGLCGKCKVHILSGSVSAPAESERRLLAPDELANGIRLACAAVPLGPVTLDPMELLGNRPAAVLGGGNLPPFDFSPEITVKTAVPVFPSLNSVGTLCDAWNGGPDTPYALPLHLVH